MDDVEKGRPLPTLAAIPEDAVALAIAGNNATITSDCALAPRLGSIGEPPPQNEAAAVRGVDGPPEETTATATAPRPITTLPATSPLRPLFWSSGQKWLATLTVSAIAFIQPLTETMLSPCERPITATLSLTHAYEWFLINSLILIGVGLGPLVLAPLSEIYGRKPVLLGGSVVFIAWNTGCGAVSRVDSMLAFRLLSGFGACVADAVAGGVIGDLWAAEERGRAFAVYMAMPLLGPALGPILGAFIAEGADWRWVFWVTSAAAGAVMVFTAVFLRETYLPRIEQRWMRKQRKEQQQQAAAARIDGRLSEKAPGGGETKKGFGGALRWMQRQQQQYSASTSPPNNSELTAQRPFLSVMRTNLQRPLRMLLTQPIVQLLALYMAMLYGIMFLFLFAYPRLWTDVYGQSIRIGSLNYISVATGLILGVNIAGQAGDRFYARFKRANNGVGKPEFRLPVMVLGTALMPVGLLCWGWAGQRHAHWIVPNLGAAVFTAGCYTCSASVSVYTIDVYTRYAASAMSTNLVTRSVAGALFPLFAPYLFDDLGFGRGCSVLAGAFAVVGFASVAVLWWYGKAIRAKSRYCAEEGGAGADDE